MFKECVFIFSRIKKGEDQGKEGVTQTHTETMMRTKTNEYLKNTQQGVYFQQNKKRRRSRKGKVSRKTYDE